MQTESPKTGMVILALLALATVLGGLLGWSMRPLPVLVEAAPTPPVSVKVSAD